MGNTKTTQSVRVNHLDMHAAYLACEDLFVRGLWDSICLVRKYGLSKSIMRQENLKGIPLSNVFRVRVTNRLSVWEFYTNAQPYNAVRLGENLRDNEGWITILELRDLPDLEDMVADTQGCL